MAELNHKSLNVALFASFQLSQPDYLSRKKSPFTEHEFTGFVSESLGENDGVIRKRTFLH